MAEEDEFFVDGGTLAPDSPSYVTRPADEELLSSLLSGEFCYVLTPRQMGKSSLMVRTAERLREQDVLTVIVDLNSIGTVSSDQWYLGLLSRIRRQLHLEIEPLEWWQKQALSASQNFIAFLREVALTECTKPIVIFIDEIDSTLNLEFRDDFFAAIRAIYNGRANEPRYKRLTFAFLGVATPTELIQDRKRTPFNIGRRIDLQEFSYQDARPLLNHLTGLFPDHAPAILHRVFHWTDGHPYLTQTLCKEIAAQDTMYWDDDAVDRLVAQTLLSDEGSKDTNLVFIQDRILSGSSRERRAMLRLYRQIYHGKSIADDDRSVIQNRLELYGLIKVRENRLDVRNEIYRHVFNADWISTLSQAVPQPRFAIFTDWIGALTRPQRWLAMASVLIALLAIVWVAVQSSRSDVLPNQTAAMPIIENDQIPQGEEKFPADNAKALQEVAQPDERAIVTSSVESVQPAQANANQDQPADYDQALQEVIQGNSAVRYAGYSANPGKSQRTNITNPLPSLGQALFFDPILSGDGHISCATCHHPKYAMADGRILPIGTGGEGLGSQRNFAPRLAIPDALASDLPATYEVADDGTIPNPFLERFIPRNSPSLINAALYNFHMWDGRIENVYDKLAQKSDAELLQDMPFVVPLIKKNVMAGITLGDQEPEAIVNTLLARLQSNLTYVALFQKAFSLDDLPVAELITLQRLSEALIAFEQSLIFVNAPWDHYIAYILDPEKATADQRDALTEKQKEGALLFFGIQDPAKTTPAVNCAECHGGNLFSDFKTHNLLVPQLGPGTGDGTSGQEDWGSGGKAGKEANKEAYRCAFRTPSLRNVTLTAPYFHDGAFATLNDAIRHHQNAEQSSKNYDVGANNIPSELLPVQPMESCLEAWRKQASASTGELTDNEIANLVEFLKSLTDPDAEHLEDLIPRSVPSGLPLEPRPGERQDVIADSLLAQFEPVQQNSNLNFQTLGQLLAPEDEHGKGDLFGADQQNNVAVEHLGLLREALAETDLAEGKRHAEHVINILVGREDEQFGDHNFDDRTEIPGDGFGIKRYLEQAKGETASLLDSLGSTPSAADLRLQVEQVLAQIEVAQQAIADTVDQAFKIIPTFTVAEARPIAEELNTHLDDLTEAIRTVTDAVGQLSQSSGQSAAKTSGAVVQENNEFRRLGQLLAPEDEHGKGDLFGADQQNRVAVEHLGLLREALAETDLAEGKRHAEHVINILVGREDEQFGDHNFDDRTEVPGDGFGIKRYLEQAKGEITSVLDNLGSTPSTADLRLQVEQILAQIEVVQQAIVDTVDQAFKIIPTFTVAEARPIAEELNTHLDDLTEAIRTISDAVIQLPQSSVPVEDSTVVAPKVNFVMPRNHAIVPSSVDVIMAAEGLTIESAGESREGAGHFHILVDTDFIAPNELIPTDATHVHFGLGQMTTTLSLDPGLHALRLQFADGAHMALDGEQYRDAITITITVTTGRESYVHVPAGEFTMGLDSGYKMDLPEFWIMQTEVTNGQYARCVADQVCEPPHNDRWDDQAYVDHPVTNVDWTQANTYAQWVGGRLPTEAEWEKACRGTDGRMYPWGNNDPNREFAHYNELNGDTKPVGTYLVGTSPYGALDMSGNVWEWTSSLDVSPPYQIDDGREDPQVDSDRILRGGSYYYSQAQLTCGSRHHRSAKVIDPQNGLRVVLDHPVSEATNP